MGSEADELRQDGWDGVRREEVRQGGEGALDLEVALGLQVTTEGVDAESDQLMARVKEERGSKVANLARGQT